MTELADLNRPSAVRGRSSGTRDGSEVIGLTLQVSALRTTPREPPSYKIFRQLVDYLMTADIRGRVKLPSERSLAETFGVGRATVREALRTMEMLDLIEVRTGDGTYVKSSGSTVIT